MPALNFKKQFAPMVESGEKKQTIRAYRKDGKNPKIGDTLYLYTGMRTKKCRKLKEVICKKVRDIYIDDYFIKIDSIVLEMKKLVELTSADGFTSPLYFFDFFEETYGLPFHGLLIEWG